MAHSPCTLIRMALAIALLGASVMTGCGDRSDESNKPADAASGTHPAVPVPQAPAPAPVAMSEPAITTQVASTSRPVIERAEPLPPAPSLRLTIELGWDNPYAGEPLPIRLYLSSPKAGASADTRAAESPLSTVGADWPSAVRFVLYQVNDGQLRPAGSELNWSKLRLPERRALRGNPVADWEIPASARLPAGEYLLRVTWDGRRSIETNSLQGSELTTESRFEIATPQSDPEKAEHAERMALLAYREGQFAKARQLAEEAIKADRQSMTPQRFQMLLAQADACLAMDDFKAGLDIYRSILKMPLDDRLTADLTKKVKVLEALVAKPKTREARPRQP
jgi:hypothetical protein